MRRKPYRRKDRFGHEVQKILSDLILKEIDTTKVGFTTISDVKMSNDLRSARIYVSVLNRNIPVKHIENYFQSRGKYLRKLLGNELLSKPSAKPLMVILNRGGTVLRYTAFASTVTGCSGLVCS